MTGMVNSKLEATLRVHVIGPSEATFEADCIIDTGFSGALTLPPRLIARLGLGWLSIQATELADGRIVLSDVYSAEAVWEGRRMLIEVDEADTDPLIGMALLKGFELCIQVRNGGAVRVTVLP